LNDLDGVRIFKPLYNSEFQTHFLVSDSFGPLDRRAQLLFSPPVLCVVKQVSDRCLVFPHQQVRVCLPANLLETALLATVSIIRPPLNRALVASVVAEGVGVVKD
jgi:hypothetical protein